jgi:hypothetical protein
MHCVNSYHKRLKEEYWGDHGSKMNRRATEEEEEGLMKFSIRGIPVNVC